MPIVVVAISMAIAMLLVVAVTAIPVSQRNYRTTSQHGRNANNDQAFHEEASL
jgi:hypothetical protein